MDVVVTLAGLALIAVALRDIFETLFHPTGRGVLGNFIARGVWQLAHGLRRDGGAEPLYAGPLGYIAVLGAWTAMLVVGWALVFWPHLPEGFSFDSNLVPAEHDSFADALYLSLVNLTSLGYGDISPEAWGLRILGPVETLFGLGLLTASISWLVSIHAALNRREAFGNEVQLLREVSASLDEPLASAEPELLERMLATFSEQLIATRHDVIQLPITHYFQSAEGRSTRDGLHAYLRELIAQARADGRPAALRVRAEMLALALDDFERTIAEHWGTAGARG